MKRSLTRLILCTSIGVALSAGCSGTDPNDKDALERSVSLAVDDPHVVDELTPLNWSVHASVEAGRVESVGLPRWKARPTSAADLAGFQPGPAVVGTDRSALDQVRDELAARQDADESVLVVQLEGPVLPQIPHGNVAASLQIKAYEAVLEPAFAEFEDRATALGLEVLGRLWLTRSVIVRGPADSLRRALLSPAVQAASFDGPMTVEAQVTCSTALGGNNMGIDGDRWRVGSRQHVLNSTYTGDTGGRMGGRVRIAVIDSGYILRNHRSFRFTSGSSPADRILLQKSCTPSCVNNTTIGENHGNPVAMWAVGHVANGVDPSCNSTTGPQRSGSGARGAHLMYYDTATGCAAMASAIQDAVSNGADIINMSVGSTYTCDRTYDCGGLNAAVTNATNAGVLIIAAAGNNGTASGCTMTHPAMRSEVLAVGGLDSWNRLADYNGLARHTSSSAGGIPMHMYGGTQGYNSGVGLMGPYVVNFTGTSQAYIDRYANSSGTAAGGTSFASPAVAGAAAMALDGFRSLGWPQNARTLRLNLLLMGDAATGPSQDTLSGVSWTWGAGRLHAAVPDSNWAPQPYWWGQSPFTLNPGTTAYGCVNNCNTMPTSVRQYNWVLFMDDADYMNAPLVTIRIKDLNTGSYVRSDFTASLAKRIQLRDAEIWGRRLQLEIIPNSLAAPITVYSGDFYHSDPDGWLHH